jgi:hypothetical protein
LISRGFSSAYSEHYETVCLSFFPCSVDKDIRPFHAFLLDVFDISSMLVVHTRSSSLPLLSSTIESIQSFPVLFTYNVSDVSCLLSFIPLFCNVVSAPNHTHTPSDDVHVHRCHAETLSISELFISVRSISLKHSFNFSPADYSYSYSSSGRFQCLRFSSLISSCINVNQLANNDQ